jgi:hypothetical protein
MPKTLKQEPLMCFLYRMIAPYYNKLESPDLLQSSFFVFNNAPEISIEKYLIG